MVNCHWSLVNSQWVNSLKSYINSLSTEVSKSNAIHQVLKTVPQAQSNLHSVCYRNTMTREENVSHCLSQKIEVLMLRSLQHHKELLKHDSECAEYFRQ